MDKENGKANDSTGTSKVQDSAALLDAANLFGAYWPRGDVSTANLFAAAGGFGLPPHAAAAAAAAAAGLPFGVLSPAAQSSRGGAAAVTSSAATTLPPSYSTAASTSSYSSAYSNTLSVAASQAASLGMPSSAAWWTMASLAATQDYFARLQASGVNFPMGVPTDPYGVIGLSSLPALQQQQQQQQQQHKSKGASSGSSSSKGGSRSSTVNAKDKTASGQNSASSSMKMDHQHHHHHHHNNAKLNSSLGTSKPSSTSSPATTPSSSNNSLKYSSATGLTIQPSLKGTNANNHSSSSSGSGGGSGSRKTNSCDLSYLSKLDNNKQKNSGGGGSTNAKPSPLDASSIFANPLSLASTQDKNGSSSGSISSSLNAASMQNSTGGGGATASGLPASILSAALEGSRLPPDTEIIKYTSSIVGPKVPGTTNRGRKKTISLDPPSVSVLPSLGGALYLDRKRTKLEQELSPPGTPSSDRVEVIKLPATNGSPSGYGGTDGAGEAPLNLSLKPSSTGASASSSLNSLSNMSASIGSDRISRRKPGPKPRRVLPVESTPPPPPVPTTPPSSLTASQYYSGGESPRPPSRNEGSDGGSSTSSTSATHSLGNLTNHKEGRPRNLGRGVSKPKKNTVASLLAQCRAQCKSGSGLKSVPMLDPNVSMSQQMNLLKSTMLAAQQYFSEGGPDEKTLNKMIQEGFRGALSDGSTAEASDSDSIIDSNHTDSEIETELLPVACKKSKLFDERLLRVPLEKGWRRETIIRGVTKSGGIKGDVTYAAPDSTNKFKQMSDITQYLEYQKSTDLTKENFTFSCRAIIGDYMQPVPPEMQTDGNEYIYLTEDDVTKRLEELRAAMRTSLPVEQRIEMARKQQAARAAARQDREQQRLNKELERSERQEAARREREARTQQLLEAKRKRQEELEKQKQEEHQRKQQERELKRQQAAILKEQEKERRRQHLVLIKAMENRRKMEEKERKKQQLLAEKQANKEKKLEQRKVDMEILSELRKPCEDLELDDNQKPLPEYERVAGLKLPGKAFADTLMVFEFLHNFGETLGFDMESLPTLESLQQALLSNEHHFEAEEELFSVMTHLLVCAIEDPGIPNPARHTTILGQSLRQADITPSNLSEILRIYLYANATGEVKALTGVHFERDREKRIADHHQTDEEMQQTSVGKNSHYYELLHENATYKMSDLLKDKPFMALSPTDKAAILAFICNELLQNKAVLRQIETSMSAMIEHKRDKWLLDQKIRKLRVLHNKKVRSEAMEKSHSEDGALDSPHNILHKDELLDDEDHDMSDNESVGTQPEEEEDAKLTGEELAKKLEKHIQTSENHLISSNLALSQLRAITFGEDRYFRRYWSLPKCGGVFVEAMESAEPEEFDEQSLEDQKAIINSGIRSLNELKSVIENVVEKTNDHAADKEVSSIVEAKKETDDNDNEHRKTPNRLPPTESEDERNLAQLKRSVDDIVQTMEKNIELEKQQQQQQQQQQQMQESQLDLDAQAQPQQQQQQQELKTEKFNLFERLGQCMERENKTEEDLKADVKAEVKEELKNEILKELKQEHPMMSYDESPASGGAGVEETKWFSILPKDGVTCDEVHLTNAGGARDQPPTEPRVPIFPHNPNSGYHGHNCESPAPLQMTSEESAQLEHIKKHGKPSLPDKRSVPTKKRHGWWRIRSLETLRDVLDNLHVRGVRERELKRSLLLTMQQMYNKGKLVIEEGHPELTELIGDSVEGVAMVEGDAPAPYAPGWRNRATAHRVDMFLLEQVEALEDKVASASMQVKGWKVPERDTSDIPYGDVVQIVKDKLASLEVNIERRYLKPPLGINTNFRSSTGGNAASSSNSGNAASAPASGACAAQEGGSVAAASVTAQHQQQQQQQQQAAFGQEVANTSTSSTGSSQSATGLADDVPKGLATWREAVNRANTSAQLAMCLYSLESSIAWDKSIMKANCQFCHSGDNEDKLLLCDSCDRGYHTYCFKPKMENIPDGDWYCHECMNKATGERNCIVCGRKSSTTGTRLLVCDLCPRAYHTDCIQPQLHKVPRGKWYCTNCISKKPQKKPIKRNKSSTPRESESSDQPPNSPTPSHSSVTTNEDAPQPPPAPPSLNCSQGGDASSVTSNSAGVPAPAESPSPSTPNAKKEKDKEKAHKKLMKELAPCRAILDDLECHDDAWPFLLPVNTKQFPTYKKIIKIPMDLSTIKKRLQDLVYKSREEFCADVRQIFNNCETFNEDDSPVGKAGHCMRQFFEARWNELCSNHS